MGERVRLALTVLGGLSRLLLQRRVLPAGVRAVSERGDGVGRGGAQRRQNPNADGD